MTMRDTQEAYELTASIKAQLTLYLSKRITQRYYDDPRLLSHLPVTILARINTTLDALYGKHLCRLFADTNTPLNPEFIDAYLDLLPRLTEKQRFIAADYFTTLARWNAGQTLSLDLMVHASSQYHKVIGAGPLPCTTEKDQQVFAQLRNAPHLIDPVLKLANHTSQITPELITELAKVSPALIDGAL
jgi:hypothetical protein